MLKKHGVKVAVCHAHDVGTESTHQVRQLRRLQVGGRAPRYSLVYSRYHARPSDFYTSTTKILPPARNLTWRSVANHSFADSYRKIKAARNTTKEQGADHPPKKQTKVTPPYTVALVQRNPRKAAARSCEVRRSIFRELFFAESVKLYTWYASANTKCLEIVSVNIPNP